LRGVPREVTFREILEDCGPAGRITEIPRSQGLPPREWVISTFVDRKTGLPKSLTVLFVPRSILITSPLANDV
jgi:hypothetical protein